MDYDVTASSTVQALWFMAQPPLPLYMHCESWRNRPFHCTCTVVWWCIYLWELCWWLRHVALTTGVFGEIRLSAVSSRLANAKPLSLSVVVCVDDARDWMVCGSGFSPGFRTVCQSSALPRTLKVLGAAGVSFPLLGKKHLPHLPGLKYSFPPTAVPSFPAQFPHSRVVCGYRVVEASATQYVFSGPPHATCAHSTSCTPSSHSFTVRSFCVRARPTSYRHVLNQPNAIMRRAGG